MHKSPLHINIMLKYINLSVLNDIVDIIDLVRGLEEAIAAQRDGTVLPPDEVHANIRNLYTWSYTAIKTEEVWLLINYWLTGF